MAWTRFYLWETWKRDPRLWYVGPACYEIWTSEPGDRPDSRKYCGETGRCWIRLCEHGDQRSQLKAHIAAEIAAEKLIWFRIWETESKEDAIHLQNGLLAAQHYPWNGYSDIDARARRRIERDDRELRQEQERRRKVLWIDRR